MTWDAKKLDALVEEMKSRVGEGIADEQKYKIAEENSCARVIGYWMYRLTECRHA